MGTRADTSLLQHPAVDSLLKSSLVQEHMGSLEAAIAEKGGNTDDTTKKKGKKDENATRADTSAQLLQRSLEDAVADKGNADDTTKKKGKNATRADTSLLQHPAVESLLKSSLVQEHMGSLEAALAEKGGNTDDTTKKKGKKNEENATRADNSSD